MRTAIAFLLALCLAPGMAQARGMPHPSPQPCGAPQHHPHKGKHVPPQCIAGTVTVVTEANMQVQPVNGHLQKIAFVAKTVFQTDSGAGTLEGIMPGDFACVTGTIHGHSLTAQLVIFDLKPFPCDPKRKPSPPPHRAAIDPHA